MLEIFIGLYCLYFAFTIYTSFMQIGFVKDSMKNKALILEQNSYIEAGNYAVDKEKLSISSSFADFVIFIFWIGFGLKYLDSLIQTDSYILKAVLFINAFIIINWILTLPFDIYKTFNLDKKYGFSTITPALYIKDTIKSAILTFVFGSIVVAGISYIILNFPSWWIFGFIFV
ncbi:MAG TPA: peptidase M48, partial [Arcobacter skirrowii]|nr:peptidase M48 [Aliarcobacter skirrowii]